MRDPRQEKVKKEVTGLTRNVLERAVEQNSALFSKPVTVSELRDKHGLALLLFAQEKGYNIQRWRIFKYTGQIYQETNGNMVTAQMAENYAQRAKLYMTSLLADEFPIARPRTDIFPR